MEMIESKKYKVDRWMGGAGMRLWWTRWSETSKGGIKRRGRVQIWRGDNGEIS